jgi:hypothetical protein
MTREAVAPHQRGAADLLRAAQDAGMALDRRSLTDVWQVHMSADELTAVFTADSQLEVCNIRSVSDHLGCPVTTGASGIPSLQ